MGRGGLPGVKGDADLKSRMHLIVAAGGGELLHESSCNLAELVLGLLADIDVAVDLGTSASVHDVLLDLRVADDGGVLLARRDGGAVTGQSRVDEETLALARVTDGLEEDSVGLDVGDESGDKRNGGS